LILMTYSIFWGKWYTIVIKIGTSIPDAQIESIAKKTIFDADIIDHDGGISFQEFKRAMFNTDIDTILSIDFAS
jgi:serine/threonine-protein phosphatase 2B regulatory subunit